MHSIVTNASWSSDRPVTSRIGGTTFDHEPTCTLADGTGVDPHECDCYVAGIRLVRTPVGTFIPTTEPDLSTNVRFWHNEAEKARRENFVLLISLILSSATAITAMIAVASLRGWL